MIERRSGAVVGMTLLLGLSGCGVSAEPPLPPPIASPPPASPLPPRPTELQLDGVDPCRLLTAEQQQRLGAEPALHSDDSDGQGNPDCLWSSIEDKPDNRWLARTFVRRGASYGLDSTTGTQVVTVAGFPAVQSSSPMQVRDHHCILLIDVAAGQSLWAQYGNLRGDYPGINHEKACQLARDAAALMIENLRTLQR